MRSELLIVGAWLLIGCSQPVPRPCDEVGACSAGFYCDPASNTCVADDAGVTGGGTGATGGGTGATGGGSAMGLSVAGRLSTSASDVSSGGTYQLVDQGLEFVSQTCGGSLCVRGGLNQ